MEEKARSWSRVSVQDLETVRMNLWTALAKGPTSVSIHNRLIAEIRFEVDSRVDDYPKGRSARAAHIAANLNVAGPDELSSIGNAFASAQACSILASSGQGKSGLPLPEQLWCNG